ncbi:MAG TPA: non-homologous end-joining DNA ligase [Chloroflexota bacterium]|nr:non-homologous end-joining DNA ligase [Chloroflexota bacterium]
MPRKETVDVLGVQVTNPRKVIWPQDGITKLDLVRYYERMAPTVLRYAARRPLTLRPFPRGIEQPGFYVKRAPKGRPSWVQTFRDVAESTGEPVDFVVARDEGDARTLVWIAQYNTVELHPWLSRVDRPDEPDWAVFDLDLHGEAGQEEGPARWRRLTRGAQVLRESLETRGLRGFPKLSGQSGLHVLVPLERGAPFDEVREFFATLAREAVAAHPELLSVDYDLAGRQGRVLIDYAQNARGKSTVAPYSVRPRSGAPVSAPVTWDELDDPQLRPDRWTLRSIFERLERVGDLLAPALELRQRLPVGPAERGTS